jgi:hypothetical protein
LELIPQIGFQDRLLRPLGHPSKNFKNRIYSYVKFQQNNSTKLPLTLHPLNQGFKGTECTGVMDEGWESDRIENEGMFIGGCEAARLEDGEPEVVEVEEGKIEGIEVDGMEIVWVELD